jgi:hypothetical protein
MLEVSRLNSTGDRMINHCGAAGGIRIHSGLCWYFFLHCIQTMPKKFCEDFG